MKRLLVILTVMLVSWSVVSAETAQSILDKAAKTLNSSGGISATYTFSTKQTGKQTGTIKMQGQKFCIINPVVSTWYDGKNQWNVNHGSGEVTLSIPDKEELQMVNPYAFISSYTQYTPTLTPSKIKNTKCIVLEPKNKHNSIRKAILYIGESDYRPVRADITDDSGNTSTIVITNYKCGQNFQASDFVFPQKQYPKVKVIDLR